MNDRIERLRAKIFRTGELNGWFQLEKIKMNSYRRTVEQSAPMRRALMLRALLSEMPISLDPDDLIAGRQDDCFAQSYNLFRTGLEKFEGYCGYGDLYGTLSGVPDSEVQEVKDYWLNEEFERGLAAAFNEREKLAMKEAACFVEPVTGHTIADYGKVLSMGLNGILSEIDAGRKKSEAGGDREHSEFYEATHISCNAVKQFAHRYSRLAEEMAGQAVAAGQKASLHRIADACARVPADPARNFFEAVQSFWLVWVAMTVEQAPNPYAFSVGRFDQFMWPFYRMDRDRGTLKHEEALEYIEALWLKFCVGNRLWAVSQNIILGGQDRNGREASNELTWLCLEASEDLRLPQPSISFRYTPGCPEDLFHRVMDLAKQGLGMPAIHNDPEVIKAQTATGVKLEDARDYTIAGCQEPVVQGCENARTTAGWFNLAKCLELALNDGVSLLTGARIGLRVGKLEDFADYQDVIGAFWREVEYFLNLMVEMHKKTDLLLARLRPVPLLSSLMGDCLSKGEDFRSTGARYNFAGCLTHGLANVADSLAAIKKLVFEEQVVAKEELAAALRTNFEGCEALRQLLHTRAPKYGNDEPYVDGIAAEIFVKYATLVSTKRNAFGAAFRPGFSTPSTHVLYGLWVGASPEGRKARETLAYGIDPMQGANVQGPTAAMRSVTGLPHHLAGHGLAFSQSLPPNTVAGEVGTKVLAALTKTYLEAGGLYVYYNIVDAETLREAQTYPEKHQDLLVRVHGMSARFVTLDPLIQRDIITRVESGL